MGTSVASSTISRHWGKMTYAEARSKLRLYYTVMQLTEWDGYPACGDIMQLPLGNNAGGSAMANRVCRNVSLQVRVADVERAVKRLEPDQELLLRLRYGPEGLSLDTIVETADMFAVEINGEQVKPLMAGKSTLWRKEVGALCRFIAELGLTPAGY